MTRGAFRSVFKNVNLKEPTDLILKGIMTNGGCNLLFGLGGLEPTDLILKGIMTIRAALPRFRRPQLVNLQT